MSTKSVLRCLGGAAWVVLGILLVHPADAALVGYWPLNETSGTVAPNLAPGGTNGTLVNGPTWTTDATRGQVLSFDGSDDYVDAGMIPALATTSNFTWSFWTYQVNNGGGLNNVALGNRFNASGGSDQWIKSTPSNFEYNNGASHLNYDDIPNDQWVQHVVVKSGTTLQYYRNGVAAQTQTVTGNMVSMPFYMGGDKYGERWSGRIDDVALWNEAVSAPRVALINGLGKFSGVGAGDTAVDSVLAAFNAGPGHAATAGGDSWAYASHAQLGNGSTTVGTTVGGTGAATYIVLDSTGNGVIRNAQAYRALIGAGPNIPHDLVDTANGPRTNVDLSYSQVLIAGQYSATNFSFAWGQAGQVTPFLAKKVGDHQYEVLAVGDMVTVPGTPGIYTGTFGTQSTFTLTEPTMIYAGIVSPSGSNNPVFFDYQTATLTDHYGNTMTVSPGLVLGGFGTLDRTYAFSIDLQWVPEPSTLALLGLGGWVLVACFGRRRRR
jgi:hypothetical protein